MTPNSIHVNMFWIFINTDKTPNSINSDITLIYQLDMSWISINADNMSWISINADNMSWISINADNIS